MNNIEKLIKVEMPSISAAEFHSNIVMNKVLLERHFLQTREQLLVDVLALNNNKSPKSLLEQIKIANRLSSYGLAVEAKEVLNLVQKRVETDYPTLKNWFFEQLLEFNNVSKDIQKSFLNQLDSQYCQQKGDVFIEDISRVENGYNVTFAPAERSEDAYSYKTVFIEKAHVIRHAEVINVPHVSDKSNHLGEHIQTENKTPLYTFIHESLDHIIKSYLETGNYYKIVL